MARSRLSRVTLPLHAAVPGLEVAQADASGWRAGNRGCMQFTSQESTQSSRLVAVNRFAADHSGFGLLLVFSSRIKDAVRGPGMGC